MSELSSPSATIHPIGWTFLGAGGLAWGWPFTELLRPGALETAVGDAFGIAVVVFALTLLGACLDFSLGTLLEPKLFAWLGMSNPDGDQWAAAWRTRWVSGGADSEFRRHEGMVSLARAYMFHSAVAGIAWAVWFMSWRESVPTLIAGALLVSFFVLMWRRHTLLILLIVRSAAKWERKSFEGEVMDRGVGPPQ